MRKFLVVVVAISLLTTGCLVSPPSGTAAAGTKYDATQDARIVAIEGIVLGPNGLQSLLGALSTKVNGMGGNAGDSARISSLETRLATAESKLATGTGGVSTATTDALSARIKTIEDWKAGIGSGGTVDPSAPGALSSNGVMVLTLERSVEEEIWMDDNVSQTWRFTIRNTGTSGAYFRINANFDTVDDAVAITSATLTPDYSASSGVIFTPASLSGTVTNLSFTSAQSTTSNKIWIGKGREESMFVTFKIDYAGTVTGKRWTWDFIIREVGG
jgi:hypothetical protein